MGAIFAAQVFQLDTIVCVGQTSMHARNLPAGNYVVKVATGTLPGGVTNTVDQGDATLNEAGVSLAAGGTNLGQDFGYRDTDSPNSISGTIWNDTNADGALSGEGAYFQGITVVLKDSNGKIVATTSTDASGNYTLSGLDDGNYYVRVVTSSVTSSRTGYTTACLPVLTYRTDASGGTAVDVTDDGNVLNGLWHSLSGDQSSDGTSKADPFSVTINNARIQQVPYVFLAGFLSMTARELYKVAAAEKAPPDIQFTQPR